LAGMVGVCGFSAFLAATGSGEPSALEKSCCGAVSGLFFKKEAVVFRGPAAHQLWDLL
jgi:hypothetical protein